MSGGGQGVFLSRVALEATAERAGFNVTGRPRRGQPDASANHSMRSPPLGLSCSLATRPVPASRSASGLASAIRVFGARIERGWFNKFGRGWAQKFQDKRPISHAVFSMAPAKFGGAKA